MKTKLLIGLIALCITNNSNGQIIVNGNFELWPSGCPYNIAPNNWTNFSTSLGPDQAGSCAGTVISYQGSSHMNLVWYSSNGLFEGANQAITGLTIGTIYQMGFYAINDQGLYSFGDPVILDVYLGSSVIFSTPELFSGGAWTAYSLNFTATSTSETIGFKVKAGISGTSGSVGVDAVTINNPTSVKTMVQDNEIKIYPNPFYSSTTLQTDKPLKNASLTVYNSFGQTVKQIDNLAGQTIVFYRDNLPSGLYFVRLKEENKIIAADKLVITDQ